MKGQWALQPQASSNIIPDVIEISAAAGGVSIRDSEEEIERRERERLREAAAESIGISPLMRADSSSRLTDNDSQNLDDESFALVGSRENVRDSFEDSVAESVRIMDRSRTSINGTMKPNGFSSGLQLQILQTKEARHHRSSSVSATMSPSSPISVSRSISTVGGQFGTSPGFDGRVTKSSNGSTSETQPYPPDFPCSRGALDSFVKNSSTLLKHFPPSPLLKRGFSRQWRTRLIVMTCPLHSSFTTPNGHRPFTPIAQQPLVCHLHLFKSSAAEERELERLEINEDSVVCVAEEEIAGRKSVVKVGGVDVGGRKKDMNVEENGRTMWFLSIVDASESQNWITLLKSAVLEQRYVNSSTRYMLLPGFSLERRRCFSLLVAHDIVIFFVLGLKERVLACQRFPLLHPDQRVIWMSCFPFELRMQQLLCAPDPEYPNSTLNQDLLLRMPFKISPSDELWMVQARPLRCGRMREMRDLLLHQRK